MSLHKIFPFIENNNFFIFIYLFLVICFLFGLLTLGYKQIQTLIRKEQQFSQLQTSIQSNKNNIEFEDYLELGTLLLNKKLFGQAIKYFKLAIYNCDDIILLGNIYNNIGYCYFKQNNLDLAEYYYNEAIIYLPDYIVAINNLAFLFEKNKDLKKALDLYEQSYKLDPQNIVTLKQKKRLQKLIN